MNLNKLFKVQAELDKRIVDEKGLQGQDLLDKKILALQVELGELANEWRGFKFWSENPKANTGKMIAVECGFCEGTGRDLMFNEDCLECEGTGLSGEYNQSKNYLLEEYVDCLHFILSIGNELGESNWIGTIKHYILEEPYKTNDITLQFNYVFSLAVRIRQHYKPLFSCFVALGEMLGFTWEQIEDAYFEKNKINHERQANGY